LNPQLPLGKLRRPANHRLLFDCPRRAGLDQKAVLKWPDLCPTSIIATAAAAEKGQSSACRWLVRALTSLEAITMAAHSMWPRMARRSSLRQHNIESEKIKAATALTPQNAIATAIAPPSAGAACSVEQQGE